MNNIFHHKMKQEKRNCLEPRTPELIPKNFDFICRIGGLQPKKKTLSNASNKAKYIQKLKLRFSKSFIMHIQELTTHKSAFPSSYLSFKNTAKRRRFVKMFVVRFFSFLITFCFRLGISLIL